SSAKASSSLRRCPIGVARRRGPLGINLGGPASQSDAGHCTCSSGSSPLTRPVPVGKPLVVSTTRPTFVYPCLAIHAQVPPKGPGWAHQPKWDGYRAVGREGRRHDPAILKAGFGMDRSAVRLGGVLSGAADNVCRP